MRRAAGEQAGPDAVDLAPARGNLRPVQRQAAQDQHAGVEP